jgi:hypothetical protein
MSSINDVTREWDARRREHVVRVPDDLLQEMYSRGEASRGLATVVRDRLRPPDTVKIKASMLKRWAPFTAKR